MSQIIKAFTGVYMVLFMMVSATGILGTFLQILQAQNLHAAIIDELENSDYTEGVVRDAFASSAECGYALEITFYQENGAALHCGNTKDIPENLDDVVMAEVTLEYPVEIAFFQMRRSNQIFGYAR